MKSAIIYVRVSTKKQVENDLPIEGQVERCQEKAKVLQAKVLNVFIERGISGRTDHRPAFQEAITFCSSRKVDFFITWSTSRFARNKIDAATYKLQLARMGTEVVYASMDIDRNTDSGFVMESVMEVFDEFYSRQVAADTLRSMMKNARSGYWNGGKPPFGFSVAPASDNPKRKQLVINPNEAYVVQLIFEKRLEGMGGKVLADWLNTNGFFNRGKRWMKSTIISLLRNEAVIGNTVFGKRVKTRYGRVKGEQVVSVKSHPALISQAVWRTVQSIMNEGICDEDGKVLKNRRQSDGHPKSRHPFTGLMRCGYCGASIQVETANSGKYSYYGCRNVQKIGNNECEMRRVRTEKVDHALLTTIGEKLFSVESLSFILDELNSFLKEEQDQPSKRDEMRRRIEELRLSNDNLISVIGSMGMNVPAGIIDRLRLQSAEVEKLELEIERLDDCEISEFSGEDLGGLSEFLKKGLFNHSVFQVRFFLSRFVEKVELQKELAVLFYSPEKLLNLRFYKFFPSKSVQKWGWLPKTDFLRSLAVPI